MGQQLSLYADPAMLIVTFVMGDADGNRTEVKLWVRQALPPLSVLTSLARLSISTTHLLAGSVQLHR